MQEGCIFVSSAEQCHDVSRWRSSTASEPGNLVCALLTWNICQDGRRCWHPWHFLSSSLWSDTPWPPIVACVSVIFLTPDSSWCLRVFFVVVHSCYWDGDRNTLRVLHCTQSVVTPRFWWGLSPRNFTHVLASLTRYLSLSPLFGVLALELHKHIPPADAGTAVYFDPCLVWSHLNLFSILLLTQEMNGESQIYFEPLYWFTGSILHPDSWHTWHTRTSLISAKSTLKSVLILWYTRSYGDKFINIFEGKQMRRIFPVLCRCGKEYSTTS